MKLAERLAVSALLTLFERYVREGKFDREEIREIRAVTTAALAAFNEPPPRTKPALRVVRVGDHDAEVVRFDRQIGAVRAEMAAPQ